MNEQLAEGSFYGKDAKLLWAGDTHQSKPKCMHIYAQQPCTVNRYNDHLPNKQA